MSRKAYRNRLRIIAVGVAFSMVTLLIWGKLVSIQVLHHDFYKKKARMQWLRKRRIPPERGSILDRNGKPLALSCRSYSISMHPAEARKHRSEVLNKLPRIAGIPRKLVLSKLRSKSGFEYLKRRCSLTKEQRAALKHIPGVDVEVEASRIYPCGSLAMKLIGFCGDGNTGLAGIEAACDGELRGEWGYEEIVVDGRNRAHDFPKFPRKDPVNGRDVVLTIDAVIQEIAEEKLREAVRADHPRWASAIVMNCRTGEILALAEYPSAPDRSRASRVDSLWTLKSISCIYEPGSTFKLITAASLLETGAVHTTDVFFAENGRADLGFARISDAHKFGYLTFREGFVKSSNIVLAKAALKMPPIRFYEFIGLFGFGNRTGIELLGESAGRVAPVAKWSGRTQATMAFGQEIGVTPLQMLNAFAAVANDGVLMVPSLIKAVVDEDDRVVRRFSPVRVRRVISRDTAMTLRAFCRDVVSEGTGTAAEVPGLEVAGKTGTAQKASGKGGYVRGKYAASFIGFLPNRHPKIAILVLLDEPDFDKRYGGVSAAPVFAEIASAIAHSTDILDDDLVDTVVAGERIRGKRIRTPNFLRLSAGDALALAKEKGINAVCTPAKGRVIAQDPDPGVSMDSKGVVRLYTYSSGEAAGGDIPYLLGLPLREAKKKAMESGLSVEPTGSGVVVRQSPRPGSRIEQAAVRVRCEDREARGRLKR